VSVDGPTSTAWKEVEILIENQIKDIALQRGACNTLEGKEDDRFSATVRSGKPLLMKIIASNNGIGAFRCCLIYELVKDGQERMAIMRNYRAFFALEVSSTTTTNACTALAAIFMIKDRRFTGGIDDVDWLHNDVLRYYRVKNDSSLKWNLADRILELDAYAQPDRQAKIKVVLKETKEHHQYSPAFHRVNNFA
jgi:hypothetical protein